jgi:hypothetical protein
MSIQDWGAIGEVVSAIGVVVTLINLTPQIRQNTGQLRSEGHQGITNSYSVTLGQLLAIDDSLFRTLVRGCQDWESITAFQQSQCHIFFHQHLMHFRMAFQLHRKGAIDDDVYRSIEDMHIRFMANPGNRIWWRMVGESLLNPIVVLWLLSARETLYPRRSGGGTIPFSTPVRAAKLSRAIDRFEHVLSTKGGGRA